MIEISHESRAVQERILILEDNALIRQTSVDVLARAGYLVDSGADGEVGWRSILARSYDLVLTDHQMPQLSGCELLCRMRAAGIRCPVILITGCLDLEPAVEEVFSAVLRKPFFLYELMITVQRILNQHSRGRDRGSVVKPMASDSATSSQEQTLLSHETSRN